MKFKLRVSIIGYFSRPRLVWWWSGGTDTLALPLTIGSQAIPHRRHLLLFVVHWSFCSCKGTGTLVPTGALRFRTPPSLSVSSLGRLPLLSSPFRFVHRSPSVQRRLGFGVRFRRTPRRRRILLVSYGSRPDFKQCTPPLRRWPIQGDSLLPLLPQDAGSLSRCCLFLLPPWRSLSPSRFTCATPTYATGQKLNKMKFLS